MQSHPAKYTDCLLLEFIKLLSGCKTVLDPFAGTGKIHLLPFKTFGIEIEKEWAIQNKKTLIGDSLKIPFKDDSFDAICTSPTYGNRMADHHNARDSSKRNTYTHTLGKKLRNNNSGAMQWGLGYQELHKKVWIECMRVLKNKGLFILNFKNHIRKGVEVDAFSWHVQFLLRLNLKLREVKRIKCPGNRFGANNTKRIDYEFICLFEK